LIATFLPAFIMLAALMAMLGATATEAREAQQIAGLFTIPIVIPLWFSAAIIQSPNSPLSIGLSLFPLTAPMTLPMRATLTALPAWQIIAAEAILLLTAAGAIWLASRAFRLGMLRYGKKLSLRELFRKAAPVGNRP
jgi:ABC-2 type transport system permease protein